MLSHIVELRYLLLQGSKAAGELQVLLHHAAIDVNARCVTGALPADATQPADICDAERARLAFWSRGVHSSWYAPLVPFNIRLHVMALVAAVGCLTTEKRHGQR